MHDFHWIRNLVEFFRAGLLEIGALSKCHWSAFENWKPWPWCGHWLYLVSGWWNVVWNCCCAKLCWRHAQVSVVLETAEHCHVSNDNLRCLIWICAHHTEIVNTSMVCNGWCFNMFYNILRIGDHGILVHPSKTKSLVSLTACFFLSRFCQFHGSRKGLSRCPRGVSCKRLAKAQYWVHPSFAEGGVDPADFRAEGYERSQRCVYIES